MLRYLFLSLALVLGIYPVAYLRKHYITDNELYGIVVGNYMYYALLLLVIVLVLTLVHYLIKQLSHQVIQRVIAGWLLMVGVVGYYQYRYPVLVEQVIHIDKPAAREQLRIAFISDLHLNSNSNPNIFIDAVAQINQAQVDYVFVGGDVLQDTHAQVKDDYQAIFRQLNTKYGAYVIMGNHEYYGDNAEENIAYIESLGFTVLKDQLLEIDGIQFVARDDKYNDQRPSLAELYQTLNIDLNKPVIVIDHNPNSIPESLAHQADVQLSGHTHAGQFFPFSLVVEAIYPNAWGYQTFGEADELQTLVSAGLGVGYWRKIGAWQMPYRFGTNSEINLIEFRFQTTDVDVETVAKQ